MNIIQKITAFFTIEGKQEQMKLVAAEINREGVILHPVEDTEHSFLVKTNEVDILLNNNKELSEEDIVVLDNTKLRSRSTNPPMQIKPIMDNNVPIEEMSGIGRNIQPRSLSFFMASKKRFSVMLYPDEYDMLMKTIKDNGYKKVEYFLACMTSAKKQGFASAYKKYTMAHEKRHKTDLSEAKRSQAEDYYSRRVGADRPNA